MLKKDQGETNDSMKYLKNRVAFNSEKFLNNWNLNLFSYFINFRRNEYRRVFGAASKHFSWRKRKREPNLVPKRKCQEIIETVRFKDSLCIAEKVFKVFKENYFFVKGKRGWEWKRRDGGLSWPTAAARKANIEQKSFQSINKSHTNLPEILWVKRV